MGEVVNLRRFRRAKGRAEAAEGAAQNRAAFGRTRAERDAAAEDARRAEARLDGHRREPPGDGPGR